MNEIESAIRASGRTMRIVGWLILIGTPFLLVVYPPGFLWGEADLPSVGPAHPASPYDGLHPYLFMVAAMFVAWAVLMIRGARDPKANAALFDWGILANLLHAAVMAVQAFAYPNELAHLWADVPLLLALCLVLWRYHPNRIDPVST